MSQPILERSQGRNLEARIEAGTVERHCLLACSTWLPRLLSYTTQNPWPGVALPLEFCPPHQSLIKKSPLLQTSLQVGGPDAGILAIWLFLLPDDSSLCQVEEKQNKTKQKPSTSDLLKATVYSSNFSKSYFTRDQLGGSPALYKLTAQPCPSGTAAQSDGVRRFRIP